MAQRAHVGCRLVQRCGHFRFCQVLRGTLREGAPMGPHSIVPLLLHASCALFHSLGDLKVSLCLFFIRFLSFLFFSSFYPFVFRPSATLSPTDPSVYLIYIIISNFYRVTPRRIKGEEYGGARKAVAVISPFP